MTLHKILALVLSMALSGCAIISEDERDALADPDGDGQPWNDYLHEYGVRFSSSADCIEVDLSGIDQDALDDTLTFDLYLKGEIAAEQSGELFPLVVWPGRFAFYERAGRLTAGLPELVELDDTNSSPVGFMDGAYHHVSFTHNGSAYFDVYVDGNQERVSRTPEALGEPEGDSLYIGCWPEQGASFVGVIGEVRYLDVAFYDGSFEPEWRPYGTDSTVAGLWSLDEGEGDQVAEAEGRFPTTKIGGSWEHFDLACLDSSVDCGPHPEVFEDADNDGFGVDEDCDDAAGDVRPGTTEKCNGYDDDCDGYIDEDDPEIETCDEETR
jgi:hypothetical protein